MADQEWKDFYTTPDGITWQYKPMYFCNPALNTDCPKTQCKYHLAGARETTLKEPCAMRSSDGRPLVRRVMTRKKTEEVSGDEP